MAQNCTHLQRLCLDKGLCNGSPPTSATWWNRSKRFVIRVLHTSSVWSKHVPNGQALGKGRLLVNLTFRELNSAFPKWRNTKMWKNLYTKKKRKVLLPCYQLQNWLKYKLVDRVNVGKDIGYIEIGQLVEIIQLFYKARLW